VDLSTFELIEELDDATWDELKGRKRLKLPPLLSTIRVQAFEYCRQLTHVTIPSSLRSIKDHAFCELSGLTMHDLKLPASIEELGDYAFNSWEGLTGKLSTHITGDSSFFDCTGLTALILRIAE
jgi:hypothetical protein